ncbi:MAG: hybrid sensor histidine kinase/response regulator [Myxococcales bacterium]|nr:hybrid sensor histidine kinase/response regulator [Myxococcales bacterium]
MDELPTTKSSPAYVSRGGATMPTVRVVAADPHQADELLRRLATLPVQCLSATASSADVYPGTVTLVVLEGMEAIVHSALGFDSYLVALSSLSPIECEGQPVLPVYIPGVLEAWVHLLGRGSRSPPRPLAHKDRLAAVGALAAGLAHEVNNPAQALGFDLSALLELLRWLEHGTEEIVSLGVKNISDNTLTQIRDKYAEARNLLQACVDGLGRITSIASNLKGFAKVQPERVDFIHPNEIVNQACALVHNQLRHRAQLIKELNAAGGFLGDKNRLVQVLSNLLVNAAQAIADGSADGCIVVRTSEDTEQITLSVIDNGPGIPEDVRERIFDPFFTTKSRDGIGVGLSLSRDIASQHGGTLSLCSTCERGTRFDLVIPRENGLSATGCSLADADLPVSAYQRARVLIVDDEPALRRSLTRQIRGLHEVVAVEGAQQAYTLLRSDTRFDVVLCDLMMPDMDGPQLYEKLTEEMPALATRFVFMTGGAFTERAQQFLERMKPPLLNKPASPNLLEATIQRVMAKSMETVELSIRCDGPPTRSFE